jgi:hypothetical protein
MTSYSFNGLASMPGYELETGFGFNGWLRLQWLGLIRCLATTYKVTALLRAEKKLRLLWLATSYKMTSASTAGYQLQNDFGFNG